MTTDPRPTLREAALKARTALSELIATRDPVVYGDALRALDEALAAPQEPVALPEGWKLYAATGLDAMHDALCRAERKGYMPDAMADEFSALDYTEYAAPPAAAPVHPIPTILFDGFAVLQALTPKARQRTSAENVADTLDAVVRILRAPVAADTPESKS